jgi:hypothetical protein
VLPVSRRLPASSSPQTTRPMASICRTTTAALAGQFLALAEKQGSIAPLISPAGHSLMARGVDHVPSVQPHCALATVASASTGISPIKPKSTYIGALLGPLARTGAVRRSTISAGNRVPPLASRGRSEGAGGDRLPSIPSVSRCDPSARESHQVVWRSQLCNGVSLERNDVTAWRYGVSACVTALQTWRNGVTVT